MIRAACHSSFALRFCAITLIDSSSLSFFLSFFLSYLFLFLALSCRDYAARKKSQWITCEELVDGLRFDILVDQTHEDVIDARGDAVEHGIITSPARERMGGAKHEHGIVGAGASSSLEGIGGSHLDTYEPAGSRDTCDDSEEEGMLGLGQVVGAMGGLYASKTRHREAREATSGTLHVTGTRHL